MTTVTQVIEAASPKLMYGGSAGAVGSWAACKVPILQQVMQRIGALEWSDVTGAGGFLIALAGFATNFYFNWRRDKREQARAETE